MADQYMVFVPGSSSPPRGPIELDDLTRRFHGGELPAGAKVARVGDTTWLPIEQVVPRLIEDDAMTIVEQPEVVVPEKTYEVTVDGEHVVGPVTLDQLRRGFEVGKLPEDARVRVVGEVTWHHILDVIQTEPPAAKLDLTVPSPPGEPTFRAPMTAPTAAPAAPAIAGSRRWVVPVVASCVVVTLGSVITVIATSRKTEATNPSAPAGSSVASARSSAPPSPPSRALPPPDSVSAPEAARLGFALWDANDGDQTVAVRYFRRSCNDREVNGCMGLGLAYLGGFGGLPKDYGRAIDLLDPACKAKNQRACTSLGRMRYFGWGLKEDKQAALQMWKSACEGGEPRGCYWVGNSYTASDAPREWRNLKLGLAAYEKGCSGGHEDSCKSVPKVKEQLKREGQASDCRTKCYDAWTRCSAREILGEGDPEACNTMLGQCYLACESK